MTWRRWLYGLADALINGAASAIVVVIADPADFNIWDGRERLITVAVAMALVAGANYIRNKHLPDPWDQRTERRRP